MTRWWVLLLCLVLSGVARGQATEVREGRIVLQSGEAVSVDGGVYVTGPEFVAFVRSCRACEAESAHLREAPRPTSGAVTVAILVASIVGFGVGVGVAFALRAP